jgi:hypothetical protein
MAEGMSVIDIDKPLEPQIRDGTVRTALKRLGYDFDDERTARVKEGMRMHMDAGLSAEDAFAEALDEELTFYGDPLAKLWVGVEKSVPSSDTVEKVD